jgi:hypothetical protein
LKNGRAKSFDTKQTKISKPNILTLITLHFSVH